MYTVYVLKSLKDGSFYKGFSKNLLKRVKEHNLGKSLYTSKKIPWIVVYFEEYFSLEEAIKREKYFKSAAGRKFLKTKIIH
jgi:putative endonuclease